MTYLKFDKTKLINLEYSLKREVLRTNRAGSFSCTTIIDCNTRKYHGLLICPLPDLDGGRHVLLSSLDETIIQHDKEFNLALHKYKGDHYEPKGHKYIRDFSGSPIPKLQYRVGGVVISKEKVFIENEARILIKYTLEEATSPTKIRFKAFLAFRNIHALSKANMDINTKYKEVKNGIASNLYHGYPDLFMQFSKKPEFVPAPDWYYDIEYTEDHERGYEFKEDLFVPGYFELAIKKGESIIFSAGLSEISPTGLKQRFTREIVKRMPRENFNNCLSNAVAQFFIQNNKETHIIAGYPWLPIRTRDALIAIPGLTALEGDTKQFKEVIKSISNYLSAWKLPDIITDVNSHSPADNSLWLIWSLQQLKKFDQKENIWKNYGKNIQKIITGYLDEKNQFSVHENGLIYVYESNHSNSWMNATIADKTVLNRSGYLVELNALWYNALCFILEFKKSITDKKLITKLESLKEKIEKSFTDVFWNDEKEYLADYVINDHQNLQIRPNQLFAASLPYSPLDKDQIKLVFDIIKSQLVTPFGIRSLSPIDPDYHSLYEGNHEEREIAAFNGSVWPWLYTQYFEAFLKIQPKTAITDAKEFLLAFEEEMQIDGICSISELYHGDPPHKAKGAISFAMNTAEILRLKTLIENNE
ncbi:MAG: glycogen debranching enzyme family protein [Salinivirgaceae bacterium]|nr:glycogen debranching enzyme family protein [Salinivirgaceae bacterium]